MDTDRLHSSDGCWLPSVEAGSDVTGDAPLSVVVDQSDPAAVVVFLTGELDLNTGPTVHDQLDRLLAASPPRLIIDLRRVSFLGATALSVLINARRAATQQGTRLQLRAPHRPLMTRLLNTAGLGYLVVPSTSDTDSPPRRVVHHTSTPATPPPPRSPVSRSPQTTHPPTNTRS
jgi:anti-sigma B factor antagonist